jgi:hypothetical protein
LIHSGLFQREFGDVQEAVSIPVGHLEFSLNEVQQLTLAHRAFVVFGHVGSSNDNCPAQHLKKLSNPGSGAFDSFFMRSPLLSVASSTGSEASIMAIQEYARSIAVTGTVSKSQVFRFVEMQFARADKDHDGLLDFDELAAFAQSISCVEADQR